MTKVVHCRKEKYDVYIGRPSKWGNPFTHIKDRFTAAEFIVETRKESIDKYKEWILTQPQLLKDLYELKDKNSKESDETKHVDTIGINPFDEQYFKQIKKIPKSFQDTSKPSDTNAKVTLPTFVRNCIHYPANKKNNFDEKLKKSIDLLREYLKSDIT